MSDLIMVVPVFNEATRFDAEPWLQFLEAHPSWAVYLVDDGSQDATPDVLEALRARQPSQVRVIRMPQNQGKAEAVRTGMERALADSSQYAGFIDADLSAPLSEVTGLVAYLASRPEAWAAIGSRVKLLGREIVRSGKRHYLGRIFATCASLALSLPVYDTQCGLKLFRNVAAVRQAFATPFRSRWIFDVELLARLADMTGPDVGARMHEVPLQRWQEHGASRLRARDFLRAPFELARIYRTYRR